MKGRYTKSLDGQMRANLHATLRVTSDQRRDLRRIARDAGCTVQTLLDTALSDYLVWKVPEMLADVEVSE
jgi:hypothetical protein